MTIFSMDVLWRAPCNVFFFRFKPNFSMCYRHLGVRNCYKKGWYVSHNLPFFHLLCLSATNIEVTIFVIFLKILAYESISRVGRYTRRLILNFPMQPPTLLSPSFKFFYKGRSIVCQQLSSYSFLLVRIKFGIQVYLQDDHRQMIFFYFPERLPTLFPSLEALREGNSPCRRSLLIYLRPEFDIIKNQL